MLDLTAVSTAPRVLSVSELNRVARQLMEQQFPLTWVAGEVSNFKRYDSGHCYFTLKDETAQVECVMFRSKSMLLGWQPENGMQVEVRACPTLYEARGRFQLNVEVMRRAGLGALIRGIRAAEDAPRARRVVRSRAKTRPAAISENGRCRHFAARGGVARCADDAQAPHAGTRGHYLPHTGARRGRGREDRAGDRHRWRARRVRCRHRVPRRRQHRGPLGV